jgi:tetrahydromethanopterin S-methyltransferase subunit B
MYKTIGIYKGIRNIDEFEKFYTQEVAPRILEVAGVIKMDFTRLYYTNAMKQPTGLEDVQFIVETYYESLEALQRALDSMEGRELTRLITGRFNGIVGAFLGKEVTFSLPRI